MSYLNKVVSGKCPHCGKEKIFYDKGNPLTFRMPKMIPKCPHCNYNLHRETGFYFGAMYISYGLTVMQMVAIIVLRFVLNSTFDFNITIIQTFITIAVVLFALWTFNYRVSRIMWLNMFYKEE